MFDRLNATLGFAKVSATSSLKLLWQMTQFAGSLAIFPVPSYKGVENIKTGYFGGKNGEKIV